MGMHCVYFAASTDEEAAATVHRAGGPGSQDVLVPAPREQRRTWFRRQPGPGSAVAVDESLPVFDSVPARGLEPALQMGSLEELLTERPLLPEDEPRRGEVLAERDGGRLVVPVTDRLRDALASSTGDQLEEVADAWLRTGEFDDAEVLGSVLPSLAELARRAQEHGHHLYCWMSLGDNRS
ncbi:hypothetical protein [Kineosporia succinea]|uniref:Uncharacterized protein n=1 Tax=Kineosporia succinea TaxID=84632 RepID=A0ABT9P819_9ACTN|nr:hypothetical protein [Kineosporia succinea]MDP9828849.1 hypothetical protein [Kineosporia succinea]